MSFSLHPQLRADTTLVIDLELCRVLLMHDQRYPWLILVPRLPSLRELHEVPAQYQATLYSEINSVSQLLQTATDAYKINVAALGNQVEQLHIHIIARQQQDPAWPAPVWGLGSAIPYPPAQAQQFIEKLKSQLS